MSAPAPLPPPGSARRLLLAAVADRNVWADQRTGHDYIRCDGGRAYRCTARLAHLLAAGLVYREGVFYGLTAAGRAEMARVT